MKKKLFSFLLLLPLALAVGGCGQKAAVNQVPAANTPAAQNTAVQTDKISATPMEMMQGGKTLDCSYSYTDDQGNRQNGEFFVDGINGKFRSDSMITAKSTTMPGNTLAHSISDGTYAYTWSSTDLKTGYKISLKQATSSPAAATTSSQNTEDLSRKIDYNCRAWTVDNSKFALPAGVTFTDMDQMLNSLKAPAGVSGAGTVNACSVCNMIPDAKTKAQCLKANCK